VSFGSFTNPPLTEPAPRSHRPYVLRPKRTECLGCGARLMGRETQTCQEPECRRKSRRLQANERHRRVRRTEPRGRQCADCLAYDDETSFENLSRCEACAMAYQRHGRCEKCQSILRSNEKHQGFSCDRCSPPPYAIEVLWTADDGRVRRLYRTLHRGQVSVGNKSYRVLTNPMTIKGGDRWARVRT
jgi:hypothetical protein